MSGIILRWPWYPLARARRVGLEQVAKEHLITFTLADYPEHQAWIAGLFAPLNRSPQIVEEHDSITSLIAAVESGRGVINVKVPYFLVAELAPLMAKRGKGAIVNLSTMVADYGAAGMALYGSSKSAIKLLTKAWAAEYGPSGVRVNAVSPGPTRTEGTAPWARAWSNSLPKRRRAVRPHQTRLLRQLFS